MKKNLVIIGVWCSLIGAGFIEPTMAGQNHDSHRGSDTRSMALTLDQKADIASVLSKYDAKNLSAADARAINEAFRAAGIKKGPGQGEAIEAAGFDPDKIRKLAPPPCEEEKAGYGRREADESLTADQKAKVASILSQYDAAKLTAADAIAINEAFRSAGIHRGPDRWEAIEAAGFDNEKIRKLAPPPPRRSESDRPRSGQHDRPEKDDGQEL